MSYIYFTPNGYMVHNNRIKCNVCHSRFQEEGSDLWICPHCGSSQEKVSAIFQTALTCQKRKITLTLPLEGEKLQFNFKKGRVIFTSTALGHPLDVTEHSERISSKMQTVLRDAKTRKLLRELFQDVWDTKEIPFALHEFSIDHLILMTRFTGYAKNFFNRIPLIPGTTKLPAEFRKIARSIHASGNILKLTRTLEWGDREDIRFLIFKNPALLFYQKPLSLIYDCLKSDPEVFRDLLSAEPADLFEHLAFLHHAPACADFLRDYIQEVGKDYLKVLAYPDLFTECARAYACLDPRKRKQVKKTFSAGLNPLEMAIPHALPTRPASVSDTIIQGTKDGLFFHFISARSTAELHRLGEGLDNPVLKNLTPPFRFMDSGIAMIGVWKGGCPVGVPVASIEILHNRIIEIEAPHVRSFHTLDEEVKQAIATWKELHHLIDLEDDPYFSTDDGDDYYCF